MSLLSSNLVRYGFTEKKKASCDLLLSLPRIEGVCLPWKAFHPREKPVCRLRNRSLRCFIWSDKQKG